MVQILELELLAELENGELELERILVVAEDDSTLDELELDDEDKVLDMEEPGELALDGGGGCVLEREELGLDDAALLALEDDEMCCDELLEIEDSNSCVLDSVEDELLELEDDDNGCDELLELLELEVDTDCALDSEENELLELELELEDDDAGCDRLLELEDEKEPESQNLGLVLAHRIEFGVRKLTCKHSTLKTQIERTQPQDMRRGQECSEKLRTYYSSSRMIMSCWN
jgi:hypothetical protein